MIPVTRKLGLALFTFGVMVAFLAAQEGAVDDSKKKEAEGAKKEAPKKLELKKLEKDPKDNEWIEQPSGADPKELINRINKNMEASEGKLAKKDPGDDTRKIQDQIVKDLDELIKQQQNNQGGGGGAASSSSSKSSSKSASKSSGSKSSSGDPSSSSGQAGNKAGSKDKNGGQKEELGKSGGKDGKDGKDGQKDGKDGKDKGGLAKKEGDGKDGKDGQGKDGKDGKDKEGLAKGEGKDGQPGKGGPGGGVGNNKNDKNKGTLADLFDNKDIWGHLPDKKRQEMDAYAKERFLRQYEKLLEQYYRTISEGRKND